MIVAVEGCVALVFCVLIAIAFAMAALLELIVAGVVAVVERIRA